MTYAEYQEYMRNFFEQYYQKLSQEEIRVTLPLEEEEKEMWSDDANPKEEMEAGSGYDFGWGNQGIGKRNRG